MTPLQRQVLENLRDVGPATRQEMGARMSESLGTATGALWELFRPLRYVGISSDDMRYFITPAGRAALEDEG